MQSVNFIRGRKMIVRARLLLGLLLLFAAMLTWGIGLSLSPHGKAVVAGTEHVRSTVVTFERNSAIGTLFLSAIAGWMLFPRLRPRQPVRDWAVIVLLASLAGSSAYKLLSLQGSLAKNTAFTENLATSDGSDPNNGEIASDPQIPNISDGAATPLSIGAVATQIPTSGSEPKERTAPQKLAQPVEDVASDDQANRLSTATSLGDNETTNDGLVDNQD